MIEFCRQNQVKIGLVSEVSTREKNHGLSRVNHGLVMGSSRVCAKPGFSLNPGFGVPNPGFWFRNPGFAYVNYGLVTGLGVKPDICMQKSVKVLKVANDQPWFFIDHPNPGIGSPMLHPSKTSKSYREWMVGIQAGFSTASTHVNICTTRQIQQNSTNQSQHATPCPKFPRLKVWLPEAEAGQHKTLSCLRSNQPLLWQRPWDKPWGWAMEWDMHMHFRNHGVNQTLKRRASQMILTCIC